MATCQYNYLNGSEKSFDEASAVKHYYLHDLYERISQITIMHACPLAAVMVEFDPVEYRLVEGEIAMLRLVLSNASNAPVTVELNSQDVTASGEYALNIE